MTLKPETIITILKFWRDANDQQALEFLNRTNIMMDQKDFDQLMKVIGRFERQQRRKLYAPTIA